MLALGVHDLAGHWGMTLLGEVGDYACEAAKPERSFGDHEGLKRYAGAVLVIKNALQES